MSDDDPFLLDGSHKQKQPWWNDGDKMGGLAASIVLVGLAIGVFILVIAVCAKLALWIIG